MGDDIGVERCNAGFQNQPVSFNASLLQYLSLCAGCEIHPPDLISCFALADHCIGALDLPRGMWIANTPANFQLPR